MTLFKEIELHPQLEARVPWELGLKPLKHAPFSGGKVSGVDPDSVASDVGLQAGDVLLAVNGHPVQDVVDVHYYGSEEHLELYIQRGEELIVYEAWRQYNQPLGIQFTHPTFDADIRRCNNLCEFCFVLQMAPRFRRTLYIKDDDYRYSFLHGHYVTLTNLSEHDWWRIETMRLSPLYVSVHVTDLALRRRFLRNEQAPDIMEQLRWLAARGIEVHTQLVVVPDFNDGARLEQSIRDLEQLYPAVASISVVPVGLTRQHKYGLRTHTPAEAASILTFLEALQPDFQQRLGLRFVYPTDEWYLVAGRTVPSMSYYDGMQLHENGLGMVRRFLDEWEEVQQEIRVRKSEEHNAYQLSSVLLATGALFAPILADAGEQFSELAGLPVATQAIQNERLGHSITAAGLLMAEDIVSQLGARAVHELVILPRVVFDHPDTISLDDQSPQTVADQLGCPMALADTMGDVWDALSGVSDVMFFPKAPLPGNHVDS